jgi:hypothetical protein
MKRLLLCAGLGLALLFPSVSAVVAEDYTKPSKHHEEMAHEVGTWDADVTMWTAPDAEPQKSKGVEKNEMFGKFWLMSQFEGEFMGQKFMGRSATGYDPIKKKYVGGWIDTVSPFMMQMEGEYDEDSETLTMMGEGIDMTGKPCKHKLVTKYDGNDKRTFEMYREPEGGGDEWQKTMVIEYTRRK